MQFSDYWNNSHKDKVDKKIIYDNWLDAYKDDLDKCKTKVLDLGCGVGNNALYLSERGFRVIACDYSSVALMGVSKNIKGVETKLVDIAQPLPFEDDSFDLIIADLSLHYFDTPTTEKVMLEIKRILNDKGVLLARVNSVYDTNYGAGQGELIEENFYYVNGYNKRFFTLEDANKFFSFIGEVEVKEADMLRYAKPKKVIEIKVTKV